MCDSATTEQSPALTRRSALFMAASAAVAASAGGLALPEPAVAAPPDRRSTATRLVSLGTAGGPPPSATRSGISNALVVNGDIYLVDCGRGSVSQFMRARLDPTRLRGIFLTHLHVDHTSDYFSYGTEIGPLVTTATGSLPSIAVYGPGSAGALPAAPAGGPGYVEPDAPTPGLIEMTQYLDRAYASSTNFFTAERLPARPAAILRAHEIAVPAVGASTTNTAPEMTPFPVYSDENVSVSAILVPHGAVFPAFAFRFETADGVIAFSGDTAVSTNLPRLARDADILVHEVVDPTWYADAGVPAPIVEHMIEVHTEASRIGEVAANANAKSVLLSHMAPAETTQRSDAWWRRTAHEGARKVGYRGSIEPAVELRSYPLGRARH